MTIGILKVILFIEKSNSLKEKRMALSSLKAKIHNNFNLAITQIDDDDKWQKATLAVAGIEKDRKKMNSVLSGLLNFIEKFNGVTLIDYEMELI